MSEQLTTDQVAELLGVQPATVRQHRWRGVFPDPDGYVGRTPWWSRERIDEWASLRQLVGRPKKETEQ